MKRKIRTSDVKKDNLQDILLRLTSRIEEATVDIHEMKRNLNLVNLKLQSVELNTKITKVDVEKMKRNTDDLIDMTSEILEKMVTQDELQKLSFRLKTLEQQ